ncbi:helix-turn-helix domain-containing protein [Nocardiopsis dassonvillei]|uniref:helix-turn-helix domain-containing protein n=1 Tax=Nocardiopsis dassonvillei TaxID=2014 RepID=UPI0033DDC5B6
MPPKITASQQAAMNQFGATLRQMRELADLSQKKLGVLTRTSKQQVGAIERGERRPSKEFAKLADAALEGHGSLLGLWPGARRAQPWWLQEFVVIEEKAQVIQEFQPQAVPGLLQTEDYARQVVSAAFPPLGAEESEQLLQSRMERQAILDRPKPPLAMFVIEEGALRRTVGSPSLMQAQREVLLRRARQSHIEVQVAPYHRGAHGAMDGAFMVMRMSFAEYLVYAEVPGKGQIITDAEVVADCQQRFGALRSLALSPAESIDFIASL